VRVPTIAALNGSVYGGSTDLALACDFRHIDPTTARIVLIEAGPRLLPGFSASLSEAAARALARLGVEVRLGAKVTVLHQGTVLCEGPVEQVQRDPRVLEVYLGQRRETTHAQR